LTQIPDRLRIFFQETIRSFVFWYFFDAAPLKKQPFLSDFPGVNGPKENFLKIFVDK
jgi:hypothetical protein